jgi:hypothetical protein
MRNAGESLPEACPNPRHGRHLGTFLPAFAPTEHDPRCQTCTARSMLSEHDHLHLGGEKCETPGINGVPGENVRCSCGSYHH